MMNKKMNTVKAVVGLLVIGGGFVIPTVSKPLVMETIAVGSALAGIGVYHFTHKFVNAMDERAKAAAKSAAETAWQVGKAVVGLAALFTVYKIGFFKGGSGVATPSLGSVGTDWTKGMVGAAGVAAGAAGVALLNRHRNVKSKPTSKHQAQPRATNNNKK